MIVNRKRCFFCFAVVTTKKKETQKSPFLLTLSSESYFTTNLMVLLKPLALMVQK